MRRFPLISVPELDAQLRAGAAQAPLLLDVRWALGLEDGRTSYLQGHIPGAVYVDMERDLSGRLGERGRGGRHPMPTVDDFELDMAACGVDNLRPVVVYDDFGSIAASRAWWLLRHFGKYDVYVLDGGLKAWQAAHLPLESGSGPVEEGDFEIRRGHKTRLDADGAALFAREGLLLDGRPADRFRGENEVIDTVAGHIPGAVSLPAASLLRDGRFLPLPELEAALRSVGVDGERPVAAYCGSGVQACHLALAIAAAGLGEDVSVYVGSWSDWITDPARPIELGD
jgi:thiosulfate/3-mercaptopyruvate sulfurtransferase